MSVTTDALSVVQTLNWPVFPCGASKRPCISRAEGGHGFHDATLDPAEIERLFAHRGAALVGTPTGLADGFDVLDIDYRNGGGAWEAENEWRLPETRIHRTMNGGRHYLFRHVEGVRNSASKDSLAPGVDVRGTGGYIVSPPSAGYTIDNEAEIDEWPDWLLELVLARPVSDEERPPRDPSKPVEPLSTKRLDGLMRFILGRVQAANPNGEKHYALRNNSLLMGGHLARMGLTEADVTDRLLRALPSNVKDWNLARKTVAWGLEKGQLRPLDLEDRPYAGNGANGHAKPLGIFKQPNGNGNIHETADWDWDNEVKTDPEPEVEGVIGEPPPPEDSKDFPATPIDWDAMLAVPPREWVYGHFLVKRFISVLAAPGGTGKTAYAYTIALSVVSGLPLLKETVHEPGNVWIYNLEDPLEELYRRLNAATRFHGVERSEVEDRLFMDSGRDRDLVIARIIDGGIVAEPVVDKVIAEIQRRNIRVMIVDPFVKSHRVSENDNDQIDFVASEWAKIADKTNCSILLVHHFRKGGVSGDASAFRGASALVDAARAAISLSTMSEDDAKRLGIDIGDRWQYIRADNAKLNLAPPPEHTVWMKLVSVNLDNATTARPADHVQSVERWEAPSAWEGMPWSMVMRVLDKIEAGPEPNEFYAFSPQSKDRWAGNVLMEEASRTEMQAKSILKEWKLSGVIEEGQYASPKYKLKTSTCVRVNAAKTAEMRQNLNTPISPDEGVD